MHQISMSSVVPLAGRLSQTFAPHVCILVFSTIFTIGIIITSVAPSLASFLLGRSITGIGAAGVLPLAIVLVLELTNEKQRGIFVGLVNSGFTAGVALGAVLAGAIAPNLGWVRASFFRSSELTDNL